jgi:uncharacterized protein YqhQ
MLIQTQEELISKMTIVGVAIACVLTVVFSSGVFTLWSTLVGVVLLLLLLTSVPQGIGHAQRAGVSRNATSPRP